MAVVSANVLAGHDAATTHEPEYRNVPAAHDRQLVARPPLHVRHEVEHGEHTPALLYSLLWQPLTHDVPSSTGLADPALHDVHWSAAGPLHVAQVE